MKKIASGLMSFSLLCLLSTGVLADHYKDLKENINISDTVWVNGTEVKPGRYLVRYVASSHEVKLERDGKVIAQAKASVVVNENKFDQDALLTRGSEGSVQLTGIRLGGQREEIQLTEVATTVGQEEFENDVIFGFSLNVPRG